MPLSYPEPLRVVAARSWPRRAIPAASRGVLVPVDGSSRAAVRVVLALQSQTVRSLHLRVTLGLLQGRGMIVLSLLRPTRLVLGFTLHDRLGSRSRRWVPGETTRKSDNPAIYLMWKLDRPVPRPDARQSGEPKRFHGGTARAFRGAIESEALTRGSRVTERESA